MSRRYGIIELLTRVGEANIQLQGLDESLTGARLRKNGSTELSFLTNQITPGEVVTGDAHMKVGLVLWIPTDVFTAAREAAKAAV